MSTPFSDMHEDFSFPPRRESFLAKYPRSVKMMATVAILAAMILPPAWIHGRLHQRSDKGGLSSAANIEAGSYEAIKFESDVNAPALNDPEDRNVKLTTAPDVRITEDTAEGSLPRISADGLRPWQIYGRPFNLQDRRPRVSLVITGLGLSRAITDQAITQMAPTVTFAFDGQSPVVGAWVARARQDGHEVLLQVPMEPFDYPRSDPGPDTLLSNLPNGDNLARLLKIMRRATGYVGIVGAYGSRFTTDTNKLAPVFETLYDRGLMVLDSRDAPHSVVTELAHAASIPVATVTERLDSDLSPEAIDSALDSLEKTARQNGRAIGITALTPVMLNRLQLWVKTLPQHGVALAPVTAMVEK